MTITKKINNDESVTTQTTTGFIFSPPKIISLDQPSDSNASVFEFTEPIDLLKIQSLLEDLKNIEEHTENDLESYDSESTKTADSNDIDDYIDIQITRDGPKENYSNDAIKQNTIEIAVDGFEESCDEPERNAIEVVDNLNENHNDDPMINFDEKSGKTIFTFSKPEYVFDLEDLTSNKTTEIVDHTKKLCVKCWIFNKPTCAKCSSNDSGANKNIEYDFLNNLATSQKKISCQYCWVFKPVGKCDHCKTSFEIPKVTIKQNKATDTDPFETDTDSLLHTKKAEKRKLDCEDVVTPKKAKWQCKICLTANNTDRETCQCCQSEKAYDESVKVKMNYKFFEFMATTTKENLDINQNDVEFKLSDTLPHEELVETVKNEDAIEMMESSNSIPDLNKTDNENAVFEENLEMAVEDDSFSAIPPKVEELLPHSVAKDDTPVTSPSIWPSFPVIQGSVTSYPNPFSFGAIPFHSVPQNDFQFSIGSMIKENKLQNIKNIRKSVKKLKSIRKY